MVMYLLIKIDLAIQQVYPQIKTDKVRKLPAFLKLESLTEPYKYWW